MFWEETRVAEVRWSAMAPLQFSLGYIISCQRMFQEKHEKDKDLLLQFDQVAVTQLQSITFRVERKR